MKQALLVIDVQAALCSGPWAAFEAGAMIERINSVTARAREAGVPVVLIQHEADDDTLAHASPGWQLAPGLVSAASDERLRKTASDSFHNTDLQSLLGRLQADCLVVCGLQTDFCVDTTVRRALGLGYPVTLVSDGHSTTDNAVLPAAQIIAHHNVTLANLDSFGPRVQLAAAIDIRFAV